MSALLKLTIVVIFALTVMVAILVAVLLVIDYKTTDSLVKVTRSNIRCILPFLTSLPQKLMSAMKELMAVLRIVPMSWDHTHVVVTVATCLTVMA